MRLATLACAVVLAACSLQTTPSASAKPSAAGSSAGGASASESASAEPSPSDSGRLILPPPTATDSTLISYTVTVEVAAGASGQLVIVVTNLGQELVPELVLRWPTELRDTVFLAPFQPSAQRIREGGDPLVQDWTKWVEGPGEHGEPAGTTSLGWGPLLVGGTLTIPVLATRVVPAPITFDLQILNGEALLQTDGAPAWTQVTVP